MQLQMRPQHWSDCSLGRDPAAEEQAKPWSNPLLKETEITSVCCFKFRGALLHSNRYLIQVPGVSIPHKPGKTYITFYDLGSVRWHYFSPKSQACQVSRRWKIDPISQKKECQSTTVGTACGRRGGTVAIFGQHNLPHGSLALSCSST